MLFKLNRTALCVALGTTLLVSACGESTSSTSGPDFGTNSSSTLTTSDSTTSSDSFNQTALLENLTDNIITPVFEEFTVVSSSQISAVSNYCQAEIDAAEGNVTDGEVITARNNAKAAWNAATQIWQQAELMQIGPLVDNDGFLRDKIYSWPVVNTCSVDFEVINFNVGVINGAPYDITNRTASRRGLAALEYLVFNEALDHSCTTSTSSLTEWNNQTDAFRKVARCEFAVEVATDINNSAEELISEWSGDTGFANVLKGAGTEGNPFTTQLEAINRISDALFYLDTFTKDGKLATPLGIFANICGSQVCPEAVESLFANHSAENIENNLLAFQKLFSGDTGAGFSSFLSDVGDQSTADEITEDVQQAIESIQSYQSPLAETLISDEALVIQTHADVREITDNLKVDFINSLALELPATAAGDND